MNRISTVITVSICLIVLGSEAFGQYRFALKGNPFPYDSGVMVRLDAYRKETKKLDAADSLIQGLTREVISLRFNRTLDSLERSALIRENAKWEARDVRRDTVFTQLNANFDKLAVKARKRPLDLPWWCWMIAGAGSLKFAQFLFTK